MKLVERGILKQICGNVKSVMRSWFDFDSSGNDPMKGEKRSHLLVVCFVLQLFFWGRKERIRPCPCPCPCPCMHKSAVVLQSTDLLEMDGWGCIQRLNESVAPPPNGYLGSYPCTALHCIINYIHSTAQHSLSFSLFLNSLPAKYQDKNPSISQQESNRARPRESSRQSPTYMSLFLYHSLCCNWAKLGP